MNEKLNTILTELRERLEALYGERLAQVVLFGSHGRGDADVASDIDILVVLRGRVSPSAEISRTGEIVADLSLRFDTVVSCVFMDEDRFTHRGGPLLRNVRREGVVI